MGKRIGRPKVKKPVRRDVRVAFRISNADAERLTKKRGDVTVSVFARNALLATL